MPNLNTADWLSHLNHACLGQLSLFSLKFECLLGSVYGFGRFSVFFVPGLPFQYFISCALAMLALHFLLLRCITVIFFLLVTSLFGLVPASFA